MFIPKEDKSEVSQASGFDIVGYDDFLRELKTGISLAQLRAAISVNKELVLLYWQIGQDILNRQQQQGWGAKVINRLAADLRKAFPEMKGFSLRNLKYMRAFAEAYPMEEFVQQAAAQIPWFHNYVVLDKVKNSAEREWYIHQTIQHGWSRNVLVHQIESQLYQRQSKAITNFDRTLVFPNRSQIDLKIEQFKPEFSGKMNFYVSALDDLLRHPDDRPTIGIILCERKKCDR